MSTGWRKADASVPAGMQQRPSFIVKHMRGVLTKAISEDLHVAADDDVDNIFTVSSATRQYVVDLGSESHVAPRRPSCKCWDYMHSHLPCKHIAGVMINRHLSWDCFPDFYKQHPLFTIDSECANLQENLQESSRESTTDQIPEAEGKPPPISKAKGSRGRRSNIRVLARRAREILDRIRDITYLSVSTTDMYAAVADLESAYSRLQTGCPRSGGLLLGATHGKTPFWGNKIKSLPKRRKRKSEYC